MLPMSSALLAGLLSVTPNATPTVDYLGRDITTSRLAPTAQQANGVSGTTMTGSAGFDLLPFTSRATSSWADAVAIGDVSGDGRADVVLTTSFYLDSVNDYQLFLFRQDSAGALLPPDKFPYGQTANRTGVVVANLDGQNGVDVAVAAGSGVTVFRSAPSAGWLTSGVVITSQQSVAVGALNLHGPGRMDLVSVSWDTGGNTYTNDGAGTFTASPWATTVAGYNSMATGDLDGDGVSDVAVASGQGFAPTVTLNRNNGNGTLSQIGTLDGTCGSLASHGIGIGDLNHDGINDVVVSGGGNSPSSCLQLYYGTGKGQFAAAQLIPSYDIPETLQVADINLDGLADVVVVHGGWNTLGVYLQQANGTLQSELHFDLPYASHYGTQGLAVGDVNGDGYPDVVIGDYNHGLVTLLNAARLFGDGFD